MSHKLDNRGGWASIDPPRWSIMAFERTDRNARMYLCWRVEDGWYLSIARAGFEVGTLTLKVDPTLRDNEIRLNSNMFSCANAILNQKAKR